MGTPNWIRSTAWVRARPSMAREAPTSSWASARCPARDGRVPAPCGSRDPVGGQADRGDLDQAEVGIEPVDRRSVGGAASTVATREPLARRHDDHRRRRRPEGGGAEAPHGRRHRRRRCRAERGQDHGPLDAQRDGPAPRPAPTTSRWPGPAARTATDTGRGSSARASAQPSSSSAASQRRRPSASPVASPGFGRTARVRRRPSSVGPEVEQAPGDDVALHLGAAAVDRRGPRVQVLDAPLLARRGRRRATTSRAAVGGRGRRRSARRWPRGPCRSTSRRRACRPRVEAVLRGARAGAEGVELRGHVAHLRRGQASPSGDRVERAAAAGGRGRRRGARSTTRARRGGGSWRRPSRRSTSPRIRSAGTTTSSKNTSAELGARR